jgi:hypothetical protein
MPINFEDPSIRLYDVTTPEGVVSCVTRMIDSSNVRWIGWPEKGSQPLMFVEFKDGSRYVYYGVTRQRAVHAAFAESSGEYLNKRIKGKYEYLKLR